MNFNELFKESVEEYDSLISGTTPVILVGSATCGKSAGAQEISAAFKAELEEHNIMAQVIDVGCIGLCYLEPIVTIIKEGMPPIFYGDVTTKQAKELVNSYIIDNNPMIESALGTIGDKQIEGIPNLFDIPVMKPQIRRILRNCGFIDPDNIKHYIAMNGYKGLKNALRLRTRRSYREG